MHSSEDLERFYFQYLTAALPHGKLLQSFCLKHKIPYNIFRNGIRMRLKVVEVYYCIPVATNEKQSETI